MKAMNIHQDLKEFIKLIVDPSNLIISNLKQGSESKEYGACEFKLNDKNIKFRIAKKTPKKIGYFVTMWKRINNGPILPFDKSDPIDLIIISIRDKEKFGQFIFPKNILLEKGYISSNPNNGKRAIRVYPAWTSPDNPIATKTKQWQLRYFFESEVSAIDFLHNYIL